MPDVPAPPHPARRAPRTGRAVVVVVVVAVFGGLAAGFWHAVHDRVDATVAVQLDPVAIEELFTPPDAPRDV
ncbi:hypothetical protein B7486_75725, partial [cyanobacterium TDX16]